LFVGESPTGATASRQLRTEPCMPEVTTGMMREQGKYQAVTRVNVSSPEITNITEADRITVREADLLHIQGRPQSRGRDGETKGTLSGSEATAWHHKARQGTWEGQTGDIPDGHCGVPPLIRQEDEQEGYKP